MDLSSHLVRRGVDAYLQQGPPGDAVTIKVPTWVVVMVGTTVIGFCFIMFMV